MKLFVFIATVFVLTGCYPVAMMATDPRQIPSLANISADTARVNAFADLLNKARKREGLRAVRPDANLTLAARNHAQDMAQNNYFSHRSLSGAGLADRVSRTGYCVSGLAENIAFGHRSVAGVFSSWFKSPGHRRNMLRPQAVAFGLAESDGTWVLVLGDLCRL